MKQGKLSWFCFSLKKSMLSYVLSAFQMQFLIKDSRYMYRDRDQLLSEFWKCWGPTLYVFFAFIFCGQEKLMQIFEWIALSSQKMSRNVSFALGVLCFEKKMTTIIFSLCWDLFWLPKLQIFIFHLPSAYCTFNPLISPYFVFSFYLTLVKFSQNVRAVGENKRISSLLFLCFCTATL